MDIQHAQPQRGLADLLLLLVLIRHYSSSSPIARYYISASEIPSKELPGSFRDHYKNANETLLVVTLSNFVPQGVMFAFRFAL